jgi:hypothetical protein
MEPRLRTVPGRWVVIALLVLIVLVIGIATFIFYLKNLAPGHA